MEKIEELRTLFLRISGLQELKMEAVMNQNYVEASQIRDEEKKLMSEADRVVGVAGYCEELMRMEKINAYLTNIKESIISLKKLNFDMGNVNHVNALAETEKKRLKIQDELLNLKINVDLPDKNIFF